MSNKDKDVLRRVLENEARILAKRSLEEIEYNAIGIPYSDSGRALHRYAEALAHEVDLILYQRPINKTLSNEEKEILRQHREAQIILDRLRRSHVPPWQWISIIFSIVPGAFFIDFVNASVQNIWLRILFASFALLILFAPMILLIVFYDKVRKKQKALVIRTVRLYLIEKWTVFNITQEIGISQRKVQKILQRYCELSLWIR